LGLKIFKKERRKKNPLNSRKKESSVIRVRELSELGCGSSGSSSNNDCDGNGKIS